MKENLKQPSIFFGHGSPMNALARNKFSHFLNAKGEEFNSPKAILVISAHWETAGTKVLKIAQPKTIHDFSGFPPELYQVKYPAPGAPELADHIAQTIKNIATANDLGLENGTWAILTHLIPKANIPVLQLSLNTNLRLREHFELAKDLKKLRQEGVLILGSGNITHNLRQVDWRPNAKPMDWAVEFDEMIKTAIENRDLQKLFSEDPKPKSPWQHALPSLDHYLPLLYLLGPSDENESLRFPYEEIQMGSLSMRAVELGS